MMDFFDKVRQKLFSRQFKYPSSEPFVAEALSRTQPQKSEYFQWLQHGAGQEIQDQVYHAYTQKLLGHAEEYAVHLLQMPYANGFALTYPPSLSPESFRSFFDWLKDRVLAQETYRLVNAERQFYDRGKYVEIKEKYYLKIVYDEIQRLTRLVNDLLDLSAMESGKFSFKLTELDINEIVKVCIRRFETKIDDKGLKVNVTLEGDHLYAAGDRDRLIQVITNLVDNSIKHCPDNGNIRIQTKSKGKKVHVSVYNDGTPIPEGDIKYIWDRFYKGDKSRTNKVSTGLGLPIVRNIITQFGEDIWVENKGQGVLFTFTLSMT